MSEEAAPSFRSPKIWLPFVIVTLIWGSTWIVIKDQIAVVPPTWSVTYRFLLGGLVMLCVALVTKTRIKLNRQEHMFAFLLGLAQFVSNFNFVYRAEHYITSGIVALIFALLFVPNALLSRMFLGIRLSKPFVLGSAIAVAGLAILFVNEAQQNGVGQSSGLALGLALTLGGILSASVANVMQATDRARSMPMASLLGWSMLWGTAVNCIIALATTGAPVVEWRSGYFIGIAYLGIIASALAFTLYFQNIRDIGPARAAYSSVVIPVIAMGLSTLFEGYRWTWLAAAGSMVALMGMIVALGLFKAK